MNDALSNETSPTAASEPDDSGSGGDHAGHGPERWRTTAEALLGDYPAPAAPDGFETHCKGTRAPRWLNWPKRCERALLRYLTTQEGQGFALDIARGEGEEMEGSGRSSIESSVQRGASAAA